MPRRRVAVFVTCLVDLLFPEVGEATASLLRDLDVEVEVPPRQVCCGQPAHNAGHDRQARTVARGLLDAFEGAEAVVAPSGSCAGMIRTRFPALFAGTRDEPRAAALGARSHELTEYLVDVLGIESVGGRWQGRVTYHDGCHGLRELGVGRQGRALLAGVEGLEVAEMERPETCCGFGGTFSLKLPDVATAMADDKLLQAHRTGARALVAGEAGCLMHLAGRMSRTGPHLRAIHLATLLAEARGLVPTAPEGPSG